MSIDRPLYFDPELDRDLYRECEIELAAWNRARGAFTVIASCFVVIGWVSLIAVFGPDDTRASSIFGLTVAVGIWLAWRYFEKTCRRRLVELDEIGMRLWRERRQNRASKDG